VAAASAPAVTDRGGGRGAGMSTGAGVKAAHLELAGELKVGQVGIANLRVRELDIQKLAQEMRERVARAPKLFGRAALIVDFGALPFLPDADTARALLNALRDTGVLPVGLAWGSPDNERLAVELGLPLLAKFRAQYGQMEPSAAPVMPEAPAPAVREPPPSAVSLPGSIQTSPVRSGQQIYAEQRDLTVLSSVGAGAEVIADGSIHIYGPLRGRALAGANGNTQARIFCHSFQAQLVAVAGQYKTLDDIPNELHGQPVQIWLDDGELKIQRLESW